jgi:hypothetical protein
VCNSAGLATRAGCSIDDLKNLPDDHEVWDVAAHYLASLCANMVILCSSFVALSPTHLFYLFIYFYFVFVSTLSTEAISFVSFASY